MSSLARGNHLAASGGHPAALVLRDQGLAAEVRHLDYREVRERDFDAISSIGLTEHIGVRNYPSYFRFLRDRLRPGGRLLNHCITRPNNRQRSRAGGFIERYVFCPGGRDGGRSRASI